jgi:hypothetical protein
MRFLPRRTYPPRWEYDPLVHLGTTWDTGGCGTIIAPALAYGRYGGDCVVMLVVVKVVVVKVVVVVARRCGRSSFWCGLSDFGGCGARSMEGNTVKTNGQVCPQDDGRSIGLSAQQQMPLVANQQTPIMMPKTRSASVQCRCWCWRSSSSSSFFFSCAIVVHIFLNSNNRTNFLGPFVLVFLAPCVLFLFKLGTALDDRRHRMSPLSEGSGKLVMYSNCPRRFGKIGHASTYRLASCMDHHRGSLFGRRKCHRYHYYHHQQQRTNPTIHPRLVLCQPTRQFPSSKSRRRNRLLVAISRPFVPIAITDSSTTSVFAKAQSAAPAGRLDFKKVHDAIR